MASFMHETCLFCHFFHYTKIARFLDTAIEPESRGKKSFGNDQQQS